MAPGRVSAGRLLLAAAAALVVAAAAFVTVRAAPVAVDLPVGAQIEGSLGVLNLAGAPTRLALGRQATVIVLMATWCKYCAYEDRWVVPRIEGAPGRAIDVVDVSAHGGIATPGPVKPAFSGREQRTGPVSAQMAAATLQRYGQRYGLLGARSVHLYVATAGARARLQVETYPTFVIVGADGRVRRIIVGAVSADVLMRAIASVQSAE
jgi:thiol-disulfide isomerase/thioredoxin